MSKRMLLIVAHGSRRQASNDEVRELGERVRSLDTPGIDDVHVAFLELAEPGIPEGLARCVAAGAEEIVVFPYFLAAGTHVAADIPEQIDAFCTSRPQVKVTLTPHLGASATLPQAILGVVVARESTLS
jgi:sirohydrochlorin ferrochelatase